MTDKDKLLKQANKLLEEASEIWKDAEKVTIEWHKANAAVEKALERAHELNAILGNYQEKYRLKIDLAKELVAKAEENERIH